MMEPIVPPPVPRLKPEGTYTAHYTQPVVLFPGPGRSTEYTDLTRWNCLDCGAVVADRDLHDGFHQALFRAACRG